MIKPGLSFLRSPRVILGEITALALLAALGAIVPQAGSASDAQLAALRTHGRFVTGLIEWLSLDHVFRSIGFSIVTTLAAVSLLLMLADHLRRLRRAWTQSLTETDFRNAAFCLEFERPAHPRAPDVATPPRMVDIRTERRAGLAGTTLFHSGLLLLVIAGAGHALFGVHATVDVMEGERLPPTPAAWNAQWPGLLAQPFRLQQPLTLTRVTPRYYPVGDLESLQTQLSTGDGDDSTERSELGVNRDLFVPGGRLYLGSDFGPAPLVEWIRDGHPPVREAPLLRMKGTFLYEGMLSLPDGMTAYLRARTLRTGMRADALEVRVMRGPALLFAGVVTDTLTNVGGGVTMRLHGMPYWVRLHGSRDPALWIAYLGFALTLIGAVLLFAFITVHTCVVVTPEGDREQVRVALKAQRLELLFEEHFIRLVRTQGGPL